MSRSTLSLVVTRQGSVGPVRTKARGGAPSTRASRREKPKTMEELDQELEAFMNDDVTPTPPPAASKAGAATAEGDVEMS